MVVIMERSNDGVVQALTDSVCRNLAGRGYQVQVNMGMGQFCIRVHEPDFTRELALREILKAMPGVEAVRGDYTPF